MRPACADRGCQPEEKWYALTGRVVDAKVEADGDIHLALQDADARTPELNQLRQRLYWARLRTMLRNKIHALLDRQRDLELPQC